MLLDLFLLGCTRVSKYFWSSGLLILTFNLLVLPHHNMPFSHLIFLLLWSYGSALQIQDRSGVYFAGPLKPCSSAKSTFNL